MKKYGFLFGAGAEIAYNMPSGGKFALDIFRRDNKKAKNDFKQMRERVDSTTSYANKWLPKLYMVKSITTFGKTIFQNIIINTLEHRRKQIIDKINKFDTIAEAIIEEEDSEFSNIDVSFRAVIERDVGNILYNQKLKYNDAFSDGNLLFESKYFSALLATYIKINDRQNKLRLKKYLLSIVQIHLGALCEESMLNINDNIFVNQEDEIDFLDDFGNILQLNYSSSGVMGLEVLFDGFVEQGTTDLDKIVKFTYTIAENIYSSVLDYKNLIDSNWMYLYNPSSDWAKFCKISIFLLSVNEYISELGEDANKENENGYYNWLKKALDDNKISISAVATTNYNSLIKDILNLDVTYLNGSVNEWYDPYLNKIGTKEELDNEEHHIIVPLIFTQSGTKPMTSISMSKKYVDVYEKWKESDEIVVVGFGFGQDDEHINGILRTLVNEDDKKLEVVTLNETKEEIISRLRVRKKENVNIIKINRNGLYEDKKWVEFLY